MIFWYDRHGHSGNEGICIKAQMYFQEVCVDMYSNNMIFLPYPLLPFLYPLLQLLIFNSHLTLLPSAGHKPNMHTLYFVLFYNNTSRLFVHQVCWGLYYTRSIGRASQVCWCLYQLAWFMCQYQAIYWSIINYVTTPDIWFLFLCFSPLSLHII